MTNFNNRLAATKLVEVANLAHTATKFGITPNKITPSDTIIS